MRVARLPFSQPASISAEALKEGLVDKLRAVQKPQRLKVFDEKNHLRRVSPLEKIQEQSREQEESDDQTKTVNKSPKKLKERNEGPHNHSVASERVAPPKVKVQGQTGVMLPECLPARQPSFRAENSSLPLLTAEQQALVAAWPSQQFFAPGGRRAAAGELPQRRFFLDLYTGKGGVAKEIAKQFNVFVLTFDFERGADQDLLDSILQSKLLDLVASGAICGVGMAPECCSFSRAIRRSGQKLSLLVWMICLRTCRLRSNVATSTPCSAIRW